MNRSLEARRREISANELLYRALRRWRIILLVAILGAAAMLFLKWKGGGGSAEEAETARADYESALRSYETDLASYQSLISRTKTLLTEKRAYLASSLLMQMDPARVGKASATLLMGVPEETGEADGSSPTREQLVDVYAAFLGQGLDWSGLSEKLGTQAPYLAELLTTNPSVSSTPIYASLGDAPAYSGQSPRETLTITVVHPEAESAELILEEVLRQLDEKSESLKEQLGPHSLTTVSHSSGYFADSAIGSRSETLLQEIYMLSTNEERLESQLAKLKKPSPSSNASLPPSKKTLVLYGAAGFLGGALLALVLLMLILTLSGRVLSAGELSGVYDLKRLAVIPEEGRRRTPIDRLAARLTSEEIPGASAASGFSLAAEALLSDPSCPGTILLAGTLDAGLLKDCSDKLAAAMEEKGAAPEILASRVLSDPEASEKLKKAEAVVLIEKRGVSSYASVSELLTRLDARGVRILGVIVL